VKNVDDVLYVNTIRFLAVDAVEQARSGHPGLPLGASEKENAEALKQLNRIVDDFHFRSYYRQVLRKI